MDKSGTRATVPYQTVPHTAWYPSPCPLSEPAVMPASWSRLRWHSRSLGLLACVLLAQTTLTSSQYPQGGGLYNQALQKSNANLDFVLKNHPDLEDIFLPAKYLIPTNFYRLETTTEYLMNVIFDPCRGHAYNCCSDTYGTPEWRVVDSVNTSATYGTDLLYNDRGNRITVDTRCWLLLRPLFAVQMLCPPVASSRHELIRFCGCVCLQSPSRRYPRARRKLHGCVHA